MKVTAQRIKKIIKLVVIVVLWILLAQLMSPCAIPVLNWLGIVQTEQTIEIARWVLAALFMLVANWACD